MQFKVLGPVMVSTSAGAIDLGGSRQRRLLAALLVRADEVTSTDRLLDIVFRGEPPAGASTTIRSYVARLRKALGDAEAGADQRISTEQGGYRLHIDADATDAARFAASIGTARRQLGDPAGLVWDGTGVGLSSPSWYDSRVSRCGCSPLAVCSRCRSTRSAGSNERATSSDAT